MAISWNFLFAVVSLLLAFITLFQTATASNTVGTACTSNATCTGPNEYCQKISWLSPACSKGMCQCLPCYTTGDFTGYSWATNPCAPIMELNLGDPCRTDYNEYYAVKGSLCIDGKVSCQQLGDIVKDGHCIRNGSALGQGEPCERSSDCSGDLWCGLNFTCECYYSYHRFDATLNQCVKKDIGDVCLGDDDCKVSGRDWDGFTWSSAACIDGACYCGPNNKKTQASYIDGLTGQFKTRTICVTGDAKVNVTDVACSIDPVYYGDSPHVSVCSKDFVCVSCPEDGDWSLGKCRRVIGKKPPSPICSINHKATIEPDSETTEAGSGLLIEPSQIENIVLITTVGQPCTSNETCIGPNEYCQEITWLKPSCSTSMCQCLPSYTNGIFAPAILRNYSNTCVPIAVLNLGDACQGNYNEFLATPFAECSGGKVECKSGFLTDWTNRCVAFVGSGEGAPCEYSFQCAGEMRCVSGNVCGCLLGSQKFDPYTGECVRKSYGDPCTTNNDCNGESSDDDHNYICQGICACPDNSVLIFATYVDPLTSKFVNKSYCAPSVDGTVTQTLSRPGAPCSLLNPAYLENEAPDIGGSCAGDLNMCFSCPEDSHWAIGKCRKLIPPIPTSWIYSHLTQSDVAEVKSSTKEDFPPVITSDDNDFEDEFEDEFEETTSSSTTTTTTTTTTPEPALSHMDECSVGADCLRPNQQCAKTYCGQKCKCKEGFTFDESGLFCVEVKNLKLGDRCNELAVDERLPPHTVCRYSRVMCNSFHRQGQTTCFPLIAGRFGSPCSGGASSCIMGDSASDNGLWCDSQTHICRCYESLAFKWNNQLDRCEKREFGDDCSDDQDCAVYGDLATGGYTYGGGICSKTTRKCECSQNFISVNFTYVDVVTNELRAKPICVHRSAKTGLAPGAMCQLDPIYYGDNPLGHVRICRTGDVCARCENDPAVTFLSLRHGFCVSGN